MKKIPAENIICFCNTTKSWGGGEKWHHEMAVLLKQKGYHVISLTAIDSALQKKYVASGIENIGINISNLSFLNPLKVNQIKKIFQAHNISSVIMNLPSDLKTAGRAAKKAGVGQIIYRRGSAIPVKNTFLNRYLYRKVVDAVLVNSCATKNTILQKNTEMISPEKIYVVYNGIDLPKFDALAVDTEKYRQESDFVIGNLGRLVYQKGQDRLIKVAKILDDKGLEFKMIIGGEGEKKEILQKQIHEQGLEKKVQLVGFVDDVKSFMHSLDVFVLSSYWEGFGYVLAEAMSLAKPIVAFDVSSNPELIEKDKTGYLVEKDDLGAMAEHIEKIYPDKETRLKMGEAGRNRVEERFTIDRAVEEVEKVLNQMY